MESRTLREVLCFAVAVLAAADCRGQGNKLDEHIRAARSASDRGDLDVATVHLLRAAHESDLLCTSAKDTMERSAKLIADLAKEIDPLFAASRKTAKKAAALLVQVAGLYRARKRPRCAVELMRSARRLDGTVEAQLLQVEGEVGRLSPADDEADKELWSLHQLGLRQDIVLQRFRKESGRDEALRRDGLFGTVLTARGNAAAALIDNAEVYGAKGHWRVALYLAGEALHVEPEAALVSVRKLLASYRTSCAKEAMEQIAAVWKNSKRTGRWEKKGSTVLPPVLGPRAGLLLSKTPVAPPYRIQLDVKLQQQPGGGGAVVCAKDAKNYIAIELNTIGLGLSLYVSHTVNGERTVIGGSAMNPSAQTPLSVHSGSDVLQTVFRLGLPVTLVVDVTADEVVVSTLFDELVRVAIPDGSSAEGAYGLARISYEKPSRRKKRGRRRLRKFTMEFSNLLLKTGS